MKIESIFLTLVLLYCETYAYDKQVGGRVLKKQRRNTWTKKALNRNRGVAAAAKNDGERGYNVLAKTLGKELMMNRQLLDHNNKKKHVDELLGGIVHDSVGKVLMWKRKLAIGMKIPVPVKREDQKEEDPMGEDQPAANRQIYAKAKNGSEADKLLAAIMHDMDLHRTVWYNRKTVGDHIKALAEVCLQKSQSYCDRYFDQIDDQLLWLEEYGEIEMADAVKEEEHYYDSNHLYTKKFEDQEVEIGNTRADTRIKCHLLKGAGKDCSEMFSAIDSIIKEMRKEGNGQYADYMVYSMMVEYPNRDGGWDLDMARRLRKALVRPNTGRRDYI